MAEYTKGKPTGENYTGNRNNFTSGEYNNKFFNNVANEKYNEKKAQSNIAKYGNGKYKEEGLIARIYGENLVDLSTLSKQDRLSFEYGYYEAANRQLEIIIRDKKIPDFIKASLIRKTKFEKDDRIGIYIKEMLYQIGYRDSYDTNPRIEEISEIIKSNNDYLEGYMTGIEEQKNNSKTK